MSNQNENQTPEYSLFVFEDWAGDKLTISIHHPSAPRAGYLAMSTSKGPPVIFPDNNSDLHTNPDSIQQISDIIDILTYWRDHVVRRKI